MSPASPSTLQRASSADASLTRARNIYGSLHRARRVIGPVPCETTAHGVWVPSHFDDLVAVFQRYQGGVLLDLGSGDGVVLAAASPLFSEVHGIEGDLMLLRASSSLLRQAGVANARLFAGDFMQHSLTPYSIVFISPDKEFSRALNLKLVQELRGLLLVYCPIYQPSGLRLVDVYGDGSKLLHAYMAS